MLPADVSAPVIRYKAQYNFINSICKSSLCLFKRHRPAGQTASGTGERGKLCCGGLTLDAERMRVFSGGKEVALSQPEYQLFQILMENKGRTVTRARLLEQIWDSGGNFVNDNTLTVTMKRLREKLGNPACIRTIRSFGYRMEETL